MFAQRTRNGGEPSGELAAAPMNASTFSGSLIPGADSTPEATSTPHGCTAAMPSATFPGVRPPDRITGTRECRCAASAQSHVRPLPPYAAPAAPSSRWKSVWKRSASRMSAPEPMRSALITRAPVRWKTAAQNDGPSSPCSCTYVRPTPSAIRSTSSSVGFTNTPTGSTWRRSARAMPAATASSQRRLEPGQKLKPIAHAPSDAACSASSCRVMPQIFTWAIGSPILGRRYRY